MSSLLTNSSSMVALQTLKATNRSMAKVQDEISTGLKVATAKDNGAVWSIAQTMRSDVAGLKTVNEALALGSATVGTARTAAESISDMLTQAKKYILAAGDTSNASTRTKLLDDLNKLGEQIDDIVASATLNGVSLVDGVVTADIEVTGAITRTAAGVIGTETVSITPVDLSGVGAVLTGLADADLLDQAAIDATLATIETEVGTVNDAASAFGSAQKQIEIQSDFVGKFIDAINTGIGALVDADMEEASARLSALQTQQQLGIQALSIANAAPQNVLALFK